MFQTTEMHNDVSKEERFAHIYRLKITLMYAEIVVAVIPQWSYDLNGGNSSVPSIKSYEFGRKNVADYSILLTLHYYWSEVISNAIDTT